MVSADANIEVVPANQVSCNQLQAVKSGYPSRCFCQRQKMRGREWDRDVVPVEEKLFRPQEQTNCDDPDAEVTSGLVALMNGEPVGWCAVEPRSAYVRLGRTPWDGRDENSTDDTVWAMTCFLTRVCHRRKGVSRALTHAAIAFARERGARAVEGYPMIVPPGMEITWDELRVGTRSIFEVAGFREVSRPSKRRVVMRIDF